MKPHKVEHYRSVLDAASETGCQLCRYMRNYQAKCIQGDLDPAPKSICNFHAWSLAAVHDRMDASRVFLYLLSSQSLGVEAECDMPSRRGGDCCSASVARFHIHEGARGNAAQSEGRTLPSARSAAVQTASGSLCIRD